MADNPEPVIMEEVTDPEELAAIRARRTRFERMDTRANRTVCSATIWAALRLRPLVSQEYLSGLGGIATSVLVEM